MMRNYRRWIGFIMSSAIIISFLLTGCGQLQNAKPITDVNHLEGQRIGVALGWAPDYLLTSRDDLTLMRYNTVADAVAALCFGRVDALSVEEVIVPVILNSVEGVRCIEQPLARDGITTIINRTRSDLLEQFNSFIADFKETPEFKDLEERGKSKEGFVSRTVPSVDSEETLRIAVIDDNYPFSYIDFETGEYSGIDVEFIRWFAYEYGYSLDFTGSGWEAMELSVSNGLADIGAGGISDYFRGDYLKIDMCFVSDTFLEMDILFIEVEDPEKLAVVADIEN